MTKCLPSVEWRYSMHEAHEWCQTQLDRRSPTPMGPGKTGSIAFARRATILLSLIFVSAYSQAAEIKGEGAEPKVLSGEIAPYRPLALAAGLTTEINLTGGDAGRNYLLVVGSLSEGDSPIPLRIQREQTEIVHPLPIDSRTVDPGWHQSIRARKLAMRARRSPNEDSTPHQVAKFPETKSFYLFVKDSNYLDADSYREIKAKLMSVGEHCLVYLDEDDVPSTYPKDVIQEIVQCFDKLVIPQARQTLGRHRDVDRNGKFTILLTHWLGELSGGKVSVGGFVRGGDFYIDVPAPFSNNADMMYLNSNLKVGKHLQTLLAHEYTHAITFSEHVFGGYCPNKSGEDEESWLSEAIAHLAENNAKTGWSNLDYRISTYLSAPNKYRLVVGDYYRAGLWRCHGSRGSTYLFLRWCIDQFGVSLLRDLTMSGISGIDNIEVATETPFPDLFRAWCVATSVSGYKQGAPQGAGYVSLDMVGTLETRLLAGAKTTSIAMGEQYQHVAPTGMIPLFVHVPAGAEHSIRLDARSNSKLQLTLVRLPDDIVRAELDAASPDEDGVVRLALTHQAGPQVVWESLSWERLTLPQTKEHSSTQGVAVHPAEKWLTQATTAAGQISISDTIDLREFLGREVVVKLTGSDSLGRSVTAFAVIDLRKNDQALAKEEALRKQRLESPAVQSE